MAYYLANNIAQSQEHTSAISPAPSKTHTPGSRLQGLGFRYYSPALGRWLSRDPAAGQEPGTVLDVSQAQQEGTLTALYVSMANNLVDLFDAVGLTWNIGPWRVSMAKSCSLSDGSLITIITKVQSILNNLDVKIAIRGVRFGDDTVHRPFPYFDLNLLEADTDGNVERVLDWTKFPTYPGTTPPLGLAGAVHIFEKRAWIGTWMDTYTMGETLRPLPSDRVLIIAENMPGNAPHGGTTTDYAEVIAHEILYHASLGDTHTGLRRDRVGLTAEVLRSVPDSDREKVACELANGEMRAKGAKVRPSFQIPP
jgi:RHS repeat-associated protein